MYPITLSLLAWCGCSTQEPARLVILHELNASAIPRGEKVIALTGATLIDGRGGDPLPNAVIILRQDRIEAVGKSGEVPVPSDAEKVNLAGMTILPGLIDAHYHNEASLDMASLYLSRGITSVRDPGAWIEAYDSVRATGKLLPRLFLTGPHLNTWPPAYPADCILVKDPEECKLAVDKLAHHGATAIKVYFGLSIGMIRETCRIAHGYGLPVTGHLETANAKDAIEAGLDGIEHITSFGTALQPLRGAEKYKLQIAADNEARRRGRYEVWNSFSFDKNPAADSLINFLAQKRTFVSATLAVFEKQEDKADHIEVNGFRNMLKFAGLAKHGGVRMVVGSHTEVPYAETGFAYFREMELLHEAGLTNMEVIVAATLENARFFRIDERLGSLEKGKLADLVVVAGDPLKEISVLRKINRVMLNGKWINLTPADVKK
jgi:imidazolonepropionase-like amidohydrolase